MTNTNPNQTGNKGAAFLLVFAIITGVLAVGAYSIIAFVDNRVREDVVLVPNEISPIYVNFYTDVEAYVSGDSYLAMGNYAQDFPDPQNVQVLQGMTSHEINGYMLNHFVAGLRVNCTYCHYIDDEGVGYFNLDEWGDDEASNAAEANKATARQHLLMTQDLNQNWLTMLPDLTDQKAPSQVQITCATCHYGAAQPNTYPEGTRNTLPAGWRLPLDPDVNYLIDEPGYLNVNGRTDISLDSTQQNQFVMYHMNSSMNVGCTHCHNSRYFPSNEVPAKYYAAQMLQMTQYINNEWGDALNSVNGDGVQADPSCLMCHREAVIPPGSAINYDVMAPQLVPEGSQSDAAAWGQDYGNMGGGN